MTIGEAAEKSGVSADTLRYYERIGVLPSVPRRNNGIRYYDESYLEWVELVHILKESGMSLEDIIKYVKLSWMGSKTGTARRQLLVNTKGKLLKELSLLQKTINNVSCQIENYEAELLLETNRLTEECVKSHCCAV